MKNAVLLFLVMVISGFNATAQNVTSVEDQTAIKKLIVDEAKAFYARNVEQWREFYRQTPQTYWAISAQETILQQDGWDNINAFVEGYFKENPKKLKWTFKRDGYNFRKVNPTYVWVTFNQTKTLKSEKVVTRELRIVELIKGDWKLVNNTGFIINETKTDKKATSITTTETTNKLKEKNKEGNIEKKVTKEKTKKE